MMALNSGIFVMCKEGTPLFDLLPGKTGEVIERESDGKVLVDFGSKGRHSADENELQITKTLSQAVGFDIKKGQTIRDAKEELLFWLEEWIPGYDSKRIQWSATYPETFPDGRTIEILKMTYHLYGNPDEGKE